MYFKIDRHHAVVNALAWNVSLYDGETLFGEEGGWKESLTRDCFCEDDKVQVWLED